MKTMKSTLACFMAAVLSLTIVANAAAETPSRSGKVVRIKGEARYSTGKKVWEPLKVGTVLKSGAVVQTAKDSFVDIVISESAEAQAFTLKSPKSSSSPTSASAGASTPTPDQDVIRVLDDTYLVFDGLSASENGSGITTETLLDLKKGSIFGSVKKQAAASRFEIKIPNGVAGIRGTTFLITTFSVACLTGSAVAAFTGSGGGVETQVVGAGTQLNTNTGQTSPLSQESSDSMVRASRDCNYSGGGRPRPGHGGPRDHGHGHISNSGRR
jgi:hypothetical protein